MAINTLLDELVILFHFLTLRYPNSEPGPYRCFGVAGAEAGAGG